MMRAAASDVRGAQARVREALAAYSPRLLAHAEYGRSEGYDESVTNGGSTAAVLTAQAMLLDGGHRDAQVQAARERLISATERQRQQRADTAQTIRALYVQALAARSEEQIQAQSMDILRSAVDLLQRQKTLGLVPENDVLRAELGVEAAGSERNSAAAALATAVAQLELLSDLKIKAQALSDPTNVLPLEVDDQNVDNSPAVTDARAMLAAARQDVEVARSERRPQVTLDASGGALGVRPQETFRDDAGGQFLVGVSFPVFDGGANAARVAGAAATADRAEAEVAQARQSVALGLRTLRIEAERAAAEGAIWQRSLPAAEDNLTLMRARYFGGGNVRLLEVLDALTQVVTAQLGIAHSRLAFQLAVGAQKQLIGESLP